MGESMKLFRNWANESEDDEDLSINEVMKYKVYCDDDVLQVGEYIFRTGNIGFLDDICTLIDNKKFAGMKSEQISELLQRIVSSVSKIYGLKDSPKVVFKDIKDYEIDGYGYSDAYCNEVVIDKPSNIKRLLCMKNLSAYNLEILVTIFHELAHMRQCAEICSYWTKMAIIKNDKVQTFNVKYLDGSSLHHKFLLLSDINYNQFPEAYDYFENYHYAYNEVDARFNACEKMIELSDLLASSSYAKKLQKFIYKNNKELLVKRKFESFLNRLDCCWKQIFKDVSENKRDNDSPLTQSLKDVSAYVGIKGLNDIECDLRKRFEKTLSLFVKINKSKLNNELNDGKEQV